VRDAMSRSPGSVAELHPAAQVERWKWRLKGWLWNPDTRPDEAHRIAQALLKSGHLRTLAEHSDLLAGLGARRCWESALQIWNKMLQPRVCQRPDLKAVNTAVRVFGNAGKWELALEILSHTAVFGIQPNLESLQHAISAAGEGGQWAWALYLMRQAQEQSVPPDVSCYGAVIKALSINKPRQALWLLHDVEEINLRPTEQAYDEAISACAELSEWQRAIAFLDFIPQTGLSVTTYCVVHAMQACANCGEWERVLQTFDELRESPLTTPVRGFGLALEACEKSANWEKALGIFADLVNGGGILEEDLISPLVRVCLAANQEETVLQLLMDWETIGYLPSSALSKYISQRAANYKMPG